VTVITAGFFGASGLATGLGSGSGFGATGGGAGWAMGGGGGAGLATGAGGGAGFSGSVAHPASATLNATRNAVLVFTWFLLFLDVPRAGEFKHSQGRSDKPFFERKPMLA
jgi:hypothetical protein